MTNTYDASDIEVLEGLEPVRKRPGMYIGGTDERALHHMAAEIVDNSMDEAVAGHATLISVLLKADGSLTVKDNGRGIPVDPHPKFPGKSALEVILCTLHAGGKFSGDSYETSGGLHGVGASVVNALSSHMRVDVARDGGIWRQEFSRGIPQGSIQKLGAAKGNARGTVVSFMPDDQIFGSHRFKPSRLIRMVRSKAYLFSGVQVKWVSEIDDGETPTSATFHFPGGLSDYLSEQMAGAATYSPRAFSGTSDFSKFSKPGKVEWALNWTPSRDGFVNSYCNTIPTPEGGTHENGFWAAVLRGIKTYGERTKNKRAEQIIREDLSSGACAMISCFIREPEFVGQTKEKLSTADAARLVEGAVRDHFDNWLTSDPRSADALLDFLILRAEERISRRKEKETQRKTATKRLRLPGKLVDCSSSSSEDTELFLVEGDSAGGSAKMARNRTIQAIMPLRGKVLNVLGAAGAKLKENTELNDLAQALGVTTGSKFNLSALRYGRVIIMTDADVDGAHIASLLMTFFYTQMQPLVTSGRLYMACPPLYRLTQGANRLYVSTDAEKDEAMRRGLGGRGQIMLQRFKGLGEMDPKDLKETTMDPKTRRLIRVTVPHEEREETDETLDRLMGKQPAKRFDFITENAAFAEDIDA